MYKLIIEDDEGKTTVVPLIRDEISIGRKEGNTIRLTERNVSRRHARLIRQNGAVYIEDLTSHNGIKVNGDRIQGRAAIGEGDRIQIGDYQLSVKVDRTEAKPPPAGAQGPTIDDRVTTPHIKSAEPVGSQATLPVGGGPGAQAATLPTQTVSPPAQSSMPTVPHQVVTVPVAVPVVVQAAAQDKPARLGVISKNFAGQEFLLDKAAVVIGRTDENDVVINHRSISRHHAKIVREGGHYHIVDLHSANGVRVNGEEYGKVELRKGDKIDLGHVRLIFIAPGQDFDIKSAKIEETEPVGGRTWLYAVLVVMILIGGVGVLFRAQIAHLIGQGGKPPVTDNDPAQVLLDVDGDILAKRWGDAIEKTDRLLKGPDIVAKVRDAATSKKERAENEKKAQEYFDRFVTAAGVQEYDEAIKIYQVLPAESVYRPMAKEYYRKIFPLFADAHILKAETARAAGKCQEFQDQVNQVLSVEGDHIAARALKEKACGDKPEPEPVRQTTPTHKPPKKDGKVAVTDHDKHEGKTDNGGGDNTEPGDATINQKLEEAQVAYVNGDYPKAIELAKTVSRSSRAWRIIGAAACNLKKLDLANEAYRKLEPPGRQYMVYVCQRNNISMTNGQFRGAE